MAATGSAGRSGRGGMIGDERERVLFSEAIGVCAALQQWWLAVGATLLALLVLRGLQALEARIEAKAGANGK